MTKATQETLTLPQTILIDAILAHKGDFDAVQATVGRGYSRTIKALIKKGLIDTTGSKLVLTNNTTEESTIVNTEDTSTETTEETVANAEETVDENLAKLLAAQATIDAAKALIAEDKAAKKALRDARKGRKFMGRVKLTEQLVVANDKLNEGYNEATDEDGVANAGFNKGIEQIRTRAVESREWLLETMNHSGLDEVELRDGHMFSGSETFKRFDMDITVRGYGFSEDADDGEGFESTPAILVIDPNTGDVIGVREKRLGSWANTTYMSGNIEHVDALKNRIENAYDMMA